MEDSIRKGGGPKPMTGFIDSCGSCWIENGSIDEKTGFRGDGRRETDPNCDIHGYGKCRCAITWIDSDGIEHSEIPIDKAKLWNHPIKDILWNPDCPRHTEGAWGQGPYYEKQ